jgi:quinoprotein glucose dehydrogenase
MHACQRRVVFGVIVAVAAIGGSNMRALPAANELAYATWSSYLGTPDSAQYSALKQINKSNVKQLQLAWTYQAGEGTLRFDPVVVGGVMYVLTGARSIVALDAATGREIWTHRNEGAVGDRGMSFWESSDKKEQRLLYLNNGLLTALDAKTGNVIATFGDNGHVDVRGGLHRDVTNVRPLQTGNPGRVFEDLIIMSLPAGGASYISNPGDVHAYDVRTGELKWTFHSVPEAGEFGAETWPPSALPTGGGVHNWSESTIDERRGIIFIPFGTGRFDFYGGNRHGANLFGNSLVALDARTGKRLWHFQTVHHDLWDYDLPAAPKLLTLRHNGRAVDAVVQTTKQGFVFVFDRVTGEPLWPIEERPVPQTDAPGEETSPTQPFPTAPPPFARQKFTENDINPYLPEEEQAALRERLRNSRNEGLFTPPSLRGSVQLPGHNGGANWGSSAINPAKGRLYVVSKEIPTYLKLVHPKDIPPAVPGGGRGRGGPPIPPPGVGPDFVAYDAPYEFMLSPSNGLPAIGPPWSRLTAYDLNQGTILWQIPDGEVSGVPSRSGTPTGSQAPRGGPVVTAGGLLFVGTSSDRKLRAYDEDSGKVLWEKDLPAACEGVPAVYEVGGRQYIAISVGGAGLFPARIAGQTPPGPSQYMVFALPTR